MANTHLLIPIKDIDDFIWKARETYKPMGNGDDKYVYSETEMIDGIKQISLNEEGIREAIDKAHPALSPENTANAFNFQTTRKLGYKQALKDLL